MLKQPYILVLFLIIDKVQFYEVHMIVYEYIRLAIYVYTKFKYK